MVAVADSAQSPFTHVPPRLDVAYLESVLSQSTGRDVGIADCTLTNLCADNWGGVSDSGATVIRLSLTLQEGEPVDLVAKILSPGAVNLFKIDCEFDSREEEVAWAQWWGQQDVPFVGRIYATRCNRESREFWTIQEYFPFIGGEDVSVSGLKNFVTEPRRLRLLFEHAADIHAHSRDHIAELKAVLPSRTPDENSDILRSVLDDSDFQALVGLGADQCRKLEMQCIAAEQRPPWVDAWDLVCVSNDLAPDNFGVRRVGDDEHIATFDWGTAHLAPMELDIDLLLRRIQEVDESTKSELLARYLDAYASKTGRHIDAEAFRTRMPWARFLFHQRLIADHVRSLRWVPYQTRSRESIRFFVELCSRMQKELPGNRLHGTASRRG
jgi:hypothetical protein